MTSKTGLVKESKQEHPLGAAAPTPQATPSALDVYDDALKRLRDVEDARSVADAYYRVLYSRDTVARVLADNPSLGVDWQPRILALDKSLQDCAASVVEGVGPDALARWRESFQAPATAWWWYLDQRADAAEQVRSGALLLLAGLFVTASLAVATDISTRFLTGGPDKWGIISTAAQSFLTFIAGASFVEAGRRWLASLYSRVHVSSNVRSASSFLLASIALLSVLSLRAYLPRISEKYYDAGLAQRTSNKISGAIESYRRAIALDPDSKHAHFGLGNAYKSVLDYDKAIVEYQKVIELDSGHGGANNQLTLCFLLKGNDYDRALEIISRVFPVEGKDPDTRYAAYKNRGWALWGLRRYKLAQDDLERALTAIVGIRPPRAGAEAHAILAQVLEDEGDKQKAVPHWLKAANPETGDYISTKWLSLAQLHEKETEAR